MSKCISDGCKARPNFNIKDSTKAIYCSKHKLEGMSNVKDKTCISEGCKTQPVYNVKGSKIRLYCKKHKQTNK